MASIIFSLYVCNSSLCQRRRCASGRTKHWLRTQHNHIVDNNNGVVFLQMPHDSLGAEARGIPGGTRILISVSLLSLSVVFLPLTCRHNRKKTTKKMNKKIAGFKRPRGRLVRHV